MAFKIFTAVGMALVCAAAASPAKDPVYWIDTLAGADRVGDGGPATAAQLSYAQGIAVDRAHNLYVADTQNHRLCKITPAGVITTIAGTGHFGMGGDGGPGDRAQLNQPYGVAVDAAGNVYVADLGNHRVRRIAPDGTIATVAGTGDKGSRGDNGPAVAAQLMSPRNVAVDGAGNLYISEFEGHRVRKVDPSGLITTLAGTGVAGFRGDLGPATSAQLAFPAGVAVDSSGAVYIADSQNRRIRKILPTGTIVSYPNDEVAFSTPTGVALDSKGNLYVAERTARVRRFTPNNQIQSVAGTGTPGYDGDGRPAQSSMLQAPADVAGDDSGNLYIMDGRRLRRVGITGILTTVAGDNFRQYVGDSGPAAAACLSRPSGLAMDLAGNLYVADSGSNRIRKILAGGTISTVAGNGIAGFLDEVPPWQAQLNGPRAVAVDPSVGGLFFADSLNSRIRQIFGETLVLTVVGNGDAGPGADGQPGTGTPLAAPRGLAADGRGNLYVADTQGHRVLVRLPSGAMLTIAGNASAGFGGDGGRGYLAQLYQPGGLAVDANGNLYIADTYNHRIRRVDSLGTITTVAGNGKDGFGGDGGPAREAALNIPQGVAVDGNGALYIADTGNHRIRKVTPDGKISTIAGTGDAGFTGDGGPATAAQLDSPEGILLDGSGALYVSDTNNNRIRRMMLVSAPAVRIPQAVVANAASLLPGPVAPGEIVAVTGSGIGPQQDETGGPDGTGLLRTEVGGVQVLFDGIAAPVFFTGPNQINVQVPYAVASRGTVPVEVRYRGDLRALAAAAVALAAPALYTVNGGSGPALVINEDGTLNSESNAAARGSVITLWATGEGQTDPPATTGRPAQAPYGRPALPVSLTIAGIDAPVLYAGQAPGYAGLMQINARAPAGFVPAGTLPLQLTVGGIGSQPGVTVALR